MYNLILGIVIVLSIVMVIAIMMQPSKQNSAASAFTGGADQLLFGKQKARGFEAVMQRSTAVMGAVWMILLFVLAFLSSK
ncbi:preprotein translocase subunit SecG [Enterococcus faecium]|uniref:preprotein translocase subunit SecG n=1 Tax=Enterococcus faecium TaxID=1352 RepID=UPI000774F902|nr:preprotein translocase subunit SecG [Enterococcus faecium]KXS07203.1 preprotein translocase subunit SecG [Enterococcus faecium]MCK6016541.1 preprotein translocase subunit SecG [Enterococcus faecium]MCK6053721.1 preprotein translocase subunit SecG [Enterococcus faecium]MCL6151534.1 preprotein translocase subunit SecG [Enterococcus faecium]MCZ9356416.1 preprotein translocase subunit SecG [Enterococcus faecium]